MIKGEQSPLTTQKIIGIYDPLSAMTAEAMGADALWFSSYSYSVSQGVPDLGLLPISSEQTGLLRISSAVNIPVYVDIDNGFGSAEHALEISKRARDAGAAGVCIEDKMSPKLSSLYGGKQTLLSAARYTGIIETIKRQVDGLEVWARIEGLNHNEPVMAVREKLRQCHLAGADCVIVHNTKLGIADLLAAIEGHDQIKIGIIPTTYMSKLADIARYEIYAIILANQLMRAVYSTLLSTSRLLVSDPTLVDEAISSVENINRLIRHGL
uniref:Phosphoenolpyruvate phosphomutase n=1 Tax=Candidatus Kentrum sp. TUN TaxID=2126343 RepID=A0A451AA35_9GAMM|nr:MAG: phosphoenolpyruvate phosphomutase [Candidatus Kentron sp. TUN]VFK62892.1 MAG: phosphoenolpyruvate phosphomutase [Candidatus Kentron sp. TUN]